MPKFKRTTRSKRYSPYPKRAIVRNVGTIAIPRSMPTLMPPKFNTVLRYSTSFTLDPGFSTAAAMRVFSANGLYDPDITGVGHQPRGFDQLMSLYQHYNVSKAVMTADFDHVESSGSYAFMCGIVEDVNSGLVTDSEDVMEKSNMTSFMYPRDAARTRAKFTSYPYRRLGLNNPGNTQGTQNGTGSTNPTDQVYLKPFIFFPTVAAGSPSPVICVVTIDYTVVFSEYSQPSKS